MQDARALPDITVPETEPETEWILGEPVQKVSPKRRHSLLQRALLEILGAWARGRGDCGPEWRFRITPAGEPARPLVPDIAFLSNERKAGLRGEELEVPRVAPDIVIEILSPDDRPDRVASKRETYLAAGVRLVLIVDPDARRMDAYEGLSHTVLSEHSTFVSNEFPQLEVDLARLFAEIAD